MKMRTWAEDLRDTVIVALICFIVVMVLRLISKTMGYTEYVPVIDFIYDHLADFLVRIGTAFRDYLAPVFGF